MLPAQERVGIRTQLEKQDRDLKQHARELKELRATVSEVRAELRDFDDRLERLSRSAQQSPPPSETSTTQALSGTQRRVQALESSLAQLERQVRRLEQSGGRTPPPVVRGPNCCNEVTRMREHLADVRSMMEAQATAVTHLERDMRRLGQEEVLTRLESQAQEFEAEFDRKLEQLGQFLIFKKTEGGGMMSVHNTQNHSASSLFAFADGHGAAQVNNSVGERKVLLTVGSEGHGEAHFYDAQGEIKLFLSGDGTILMKGRRIADQAEIFELASREGVVPGTVMAIDDEGRLRPASEPYDPRVVGVISGAGELRPGLVLGAREDGSTDLPVALNGQVYVRVSTEAGPVQPGDLLVPSSQPGVAMRASDRQRAIGAILGKALEAYEPARDTKASDVTAGEGLVRMLVMVR